MRSSLGRAERGFTLVEALVALAILGLAVIVALEVGAQTLRAQAAAERHLEAVVAAESRLTELTLLPADSLAMYSEPRWGTVVLSRPYRWRALVRPEPQADGLWRAAVVIEWAAGDLAVETVFYRRGRAMKREFSP
ncbi:MAG: prepilin-type N-terminal cleavage/methylation domain-containing protein [Gemmatimonadota bacterium]|nr:prepilin-type N-terminal cleavage/methylation domain-containing protein [Gemmatimonadota bacterium]